MERPSMQINPNPTAPIEVPTVAKKKLFDFNFDKQRFIVYALVILTFGVLLFYLFYRSQKRRADSLANINNDLNKKLYGDAELEIPPTSAVKPNDRKIQELTKERNMWRKAANELMELYTNSIEDMLDKEQVKDIEFDKEDEPQPPVEGRGKVLKIHQNRVKEIDFSEEQTAWEAAKAENTLEAYERFYKNEYKTARFKGAAARKLNQLKKPQDV
jgi:hypothetical protein